jgi:PhnB protein
VTTAQPQATANRLQLAPYLFFYGRCEEALEFYKGVFGGAYELQRNSKAPADCPVGPEMKEKVMHASFTAPGLTFMASDGRELKSVNPDEGNISLSLSITEFGEAERLFQALAIGGTVKMPLDDAFWGGKFGMIHDRFGTEWLIVAP